MRATELQHEMVDAWREVFRDMGESCMRLLIRKDGSGARLVPDPRLHDIKPEARGKERDIPMPVVRQLIQSGWIGKLTEHRSDHKIGWREIGLDGENNDVYCCVQ